MLRALRHTPIKRDCPPELTRACSAGRYFDLFAPFRSPKERQTDEKRFSSTATGATNRRISNDNRGERLAGASSLRPVRFNISYSAWELLHLRRPGCKHSDHATQY